MLRLPKKPETDVHFILRSRRAAMKVEMRQSDGVRSCTASEAALKRRSTSGRFSWKVLMLNLATASLRELTCLPEAFATCGGSGAKRGEKKQGCDPLRNGQACTPAMHVLPHA